MLSRDLAFCQVSLKTVQRFSEEKSNMSQPIWGRTAVSFFRSPEKHKIGRRRWDLASCQVLFNSVQKFQRRSRRCLSQSEAKRPSLFSDRPKNTKLVEDVEILLPVKFCLIPFRSFRGEVEDVSANQRPCQPFFYRPKQQKKKNNSQTTLVEDIEILLPVEFLKWFQRRGRKCLCQSQVGGGHIVFRSAKKKKKKNPQTWQRTLRFCFLSS